MTDLESPRPRKLFGRRRKQASPDTNRGIVGALDWRF
jgi:hypothetical protein